ncbi:SDR family oxidoreductase [Halorhodospira halophila]|uniref:NAD dependent epimerase/dehydratase family n=1 Tax=Halorhodospira halophila (strain DSM 244 / SL1) TaxID=349124 RepID=A1WU14_HALHL|nr:SDR family oxidoreductase [Halorhodospira halophila]ABM61176.1 NAD dependent epimerase/dehydratase family [Halorhodospira halophila SL1]MBK1729631.1 NAD(P)-dependent oxidoreductase [Halorhodospira halophila]
MTMRTVLLFGATRGVGWLLAERLRDRGRRVVALARALQQAEGLERLGVDVIEGDVTDADSVPRAFEAAGRGAAVVSTVSGMLERGRFVDEMGNMLITDAARGWDPYRVVLVTAIGCGETRPYRSRQAIEAFGQIVDAKTRAENYLRGSGLPHLLIRPGGLLDGPPSGQAELTRAVDAHGNIRRADLAALLEAVIDQQDGDGQAFSAIDPTQPSAARRRQTVDPEKGASP